MSEKNQILFSIKSCPCNKLIIGAILIASGRVPNIHIVLKVIKVHLITNIVNTLALFHVSMPLYSRVNTVIYKKTSYNMRLKRIVIWIYYFNKDVLCQRNLNVIYGKN